jgi:lipopolysaccharide heptosyltransferase II
MDSAWSRASRWLCIRLDAMGDVLMTTPALRAIREGAPNRRITLLTSRSGGAIASMVPEIDEVIRYDAPWMKQTTPRADSQPEWAMAEKLRQRRFDAAVIFTVYSQNPLPSALLCCLADIPLRVAHCRENPYQLLSDWVAETEPQQGVRHEVRRQLDLVASIGCQTGDERLSLRVPTDIKDRVASLLSARGLDRQRPWLVVHPGATAPSRRYPPESFAIAARKLALEHGCQIVFTGDDSERALIGQICSEMSAPAFDLSGSLRLNELGGLLSLAPLLIANNTGPVHMAAALGTPVVDLYALTNPQHTPWAVPNRVLSHDVDCKYCYKSICPEGHNDCLRKVSPQAVVDAALELLGAREIDRPVLSRCL